MPPALPQDNITPKKPSPHHFASTGKSAELRKELRPELIDKVKYNDSSAFRRIFASEVVVDPLLIDASLARDALDRRAVRTVRDELVRGGYQDLSLRFFGVPTHVLSNSNDTVAIITQSDYRKFQRNRWNC